MALLEALHHVWHYIAAGLTIFIAVVASGHAILFKRDSRAAVLWVGVIWLAPVIGAVLYLLLGINRIRRRAILLRGNLRRYQSEPSAAPILPEEVESRLAPQVGHLKKLARLVESVVTRPLVPGNHFDPLVNGDMAFPAMLEAIRSARQSVALATYIFDNSPCGEDFVAALGGAAKRGVQVRVLVDDAGARYSWPSIVPALRGAGVPVARFLPSFGPLRFMSMNLRNHRKILVVDGKIGFTGGMNIRQGNLIKTQPRHPVQDLQFRLTGPVVAQLQEIFTDDWFFCTGEGLRGERWFPKLQETGGVMARAISDGPDEDFEKLRWTLLGALSCAHTSVRIVTPYFLPDQAVISALNLAALRGVQVDILLPEKNNLPYVKWATFALLWQLLERGCRVWLTPPPFDHSKLMIVDHHWSLIGSANWDPRSLRLNFELNVECYDHQLARHLEKIVRARLVQARRLTLQEVDARPLPVRLRDGFARLFTPFM